MDKLEEKILEFANWNSDTTEIYLESVKKLIELGMEEDEAVEFLQNLYSAANDFGG